MERKEMVEEMRAAPERLRTLLDGRLDSGPDEGGWTTKDVLSHLLHTELVYGYRFRTILTRTNPDIPAYDQEAWASRFAPLDAVDPRRTLDLVTAMRAWNTGLLDSLSDQEWERWGTHEERGVESVERIVTELVAHDAEHLAQIERMP